MLGSSVLGDNGNAGDSFVRELNGPGDGLSVAAVQAFTALRKQCL